MNVSASALALLGCSVLGGSIVLAQETPAPTFKAGVDLVTVSVTVNHRDGRPATDLGRADFELFDAGRPRIIADFKSEPAPISVAVLVDASGSMRGAPKLTQARTAIAQLTSWLDRGSDLVALFSFDTELHELQPFTTATAGVADRIDGIRPFGSTALYDAIAQTGERVAGQGGPRRAVVVVTDGSDNHSRLSARAVSHIASSIDVPVYVIVVASSLDDPRSDAAPDRNSLDMRTGPLADLAQWTGGSLSVVNTPADANATARRIVAELRHQYLMTFEASAPEGWHPLVVRARDSHLVVRARSGYIAGSGAALRPEVE
jgi:Ca-activated chloride channel family protein